MKAQAIALVNQLLENEKPLKVEALMGGLSGSSIIKISAPTQTYVVKFLDKNLSSLNTQEIECQQIASKQGYGPQVYATDIERGVIVMEYLPADTFIGGSELRLVKIVELLKKIHTGPMYPTTISIPNIIENNLQGVYKQDPCIVNSAELRLIVSNIHQAVSNMPLIVPCHRDVNPGNIIYARDQFFAIDYTGSTQDDAYIDLAEVALYFCSSVSAEKRLLVLYLKRYPSDQELAKLAFMKALVRIAYGLFFLRQDQKDRGMEMINEAVAYYYSNTFEKDKALLLESLS